MRRVIAPDRDHLARQHGREQPCLRAGDFLAGEGDLAEGVYVDHAQSGVNRQVGVTVIDSIDSGEDDLGSDGDAGDEHAVTLSKAQVLAERSRL